MDHCVNYYERHIGDYLKDTAHLSLLEHGVYSRLLDVYYTRESGIPVSECGRLVGAKSKDERSALGVVLAEFFVVEDGILKQARCDLEIARFQDKQRKAKASADARWAHTERNANASPNAMRTHSEGNAPSLQTPDPDPTPEKRTEAIASAALTVVDDRKDAIFALGLPMLTTAGVDEKQARAFLGFLRKHNTDAAVVEALKRCSIERALQPIPFLQACLKTGKKHDNRQEALEADGKRVAAQWARESA